MSRYILVPVEGDDKDNIPVTLPDGLVYDELYEELQSKVDDIKKLKRLLKTLFENGVEEGDEGSIIHQGQKISNILLRDAVIDTCNSKFYEKYEMFYKLLRKFKVIF